MRIFTILDAARDTRIYSRLGEFDGDVVPLFRGERAVELAAVAPYLVRLQHGDEFTDWLFTYGWGNSWGIFVESSAEMEDLKQHFQDLVMVYDEKGTPLYFRYYDPRVFRVYLPTCNASELKTVFGPVSAFYVEGEKPGSVIHYALADQELVERGIQVQDHASPTR